MAKSYADRSSKCQVGWPPHTLNEAPRSSKFQETIVPSQACQGTNLLEIHVGVRGLHPRNRSPFARHSLAMRSGKEQLNVCVHVYVGLFKAGENPGKTRGKPGETSVSRGKTG